MSPEELIKQTVTVDEAAKLLGISRATAYQLAHEGKLPGARRLGRRIVVSRKALEFFFGRYGSRILTRGNPNTSPIK